MFNFLKPKIVTQATTLLREQIDESKVDNELWQKNFGNAFVLGYIMGFCTVLIKSKTKSDEETASGTKQVFENLFGKNKGIRVMATAQMHSREQDFQEGLEKARLDLIEWIDNNGKQPHSLLDYLKNK